MESEEFSYFCTTRLILMTIDYIQHTTEFHIFPGLVRASNIRHTHFSRNTKIAGYLHAYKLVKEFGEGVDRMYREMEEAGCPAPEFKQQDFMVYATIRQHRDAVNGNGQLKGDGELNGTLSGTPRDNGTLNGTLNGT